MVLFCIWSYLQHTLSPPPQLSCVYCRRSAGCRPPPVLSFSPFTFGPFARLSGPKAVVHVVFPNSRLTCLLSPTCRLGAPWRTLRRQAGNPETKSTARRVLIQEKRSGVDGKLQVGPTFGCVGCDAFALLRRHDSK